MGFTEKNTKKAGKKQGDLKTKEEKEKHQQLGKCITLVGGHGVAWHKLNPSQAIPINTAEQPVIIRMGDQSPLHRWNLYIFRAMKNLSEWDKTIAWLLMKQVHYTLN